MTQPTTSGAGLTVGAATVSPSALLCRFVEVRRACLHSPMFQPRLFDFLDCAGATAAPGYALTFACAFQVSCENIRLLISASQ